MQLGTSRCSRHATCDWPCRESTELPWVDRGACGKKERFKMFGLSLGNQHRAQFGTAHPLARRTVRVCAASDAQQAQRGEIWFRTL